MKQKTMMTLTRIQGQIITSVFAVDTHAWKDQLGVVSVQNAQHVWKRAIIESKKKNTMEKKDIKQFLHLYVGCECETDSGIKGKLITINSEAGIAVIRIGEGLGQTVSKLYSEVTPILRPLSSMTEEEREDVGNLVGKGEHPLWVKSIATVTKWYLDRGFDIFQLIEQGLAIDSTLKPV